MLSVWRICRAKYEASAFSGYGAEKTGGRWNSKGIPIIYTSENLSLGALELFVHVSPGIIPADLISIRGTLPISVSSEAIEASELPTNWRDYPASASLQKLGTEWFQRRESLLLMIPSAINPLERNILINPTHPEFDKLQVDVGQPFQFDPRMFGK